MNTLNTEREKHGLKPIKACPYNRGFACIHPSGRSCPSCTIYEKLEKRAKIFSEAHPEIGPLEPWQYALIRDSMTMR